MLSVSSSYISLLYSQGNKPIAEEASSFRNNLNPPATSILPAREAISFSPEGRNLSRRQSDSSSSDTDFSEASASNNTLLGSRNNELTYNEAAELKKLQARNTEVRAHEQAHLAAAGQYARGSASFDYQQGPDGRKYAVGGEVSIDIGRENTPEITIAKMQTVKRAALAPANPSAADRQIAAQASANLAVAQQELRQERQAEIQTRFQQANSEDTPSISATESSYTNVGSAATTRTRTLMVEAYRAVNEYL